MEERAPQPLFDNLYAIDMPAAQQTLCYLDELSLTGIDKEYDLARRFLRSYAGSEDTFNSYRREVERLCQWAWLWRQKSLNMLNRDDVKAYINFVQNPPATWVTDKHQPRFLSNEHGQRVPNTQWRPFLKRSQLKNRGTAVSGMSQATVRAVMAGASTFFTYLQQENHLSQNPVMLMRQKSQFLQRQQQTRISRKLSDVQWETLIDALIKRCDKDVRFERHLFIFSAFYLMGLRISELSETERHQPTMSDFFRDQRNLWWFRAVGKGNKIREIAVCDAMLTQLIRYRRYLALTDYPLPGERTPILLKEKGRGGIGARQLRKLVQAGFDLAISTLMSEGKSDEAERMRQTTVHWLRHTAISRDVQIRPREHVRDDAGHQSVQITDRYIDIDLQARHESAREKTLTNRGDSHDIQDCS